MINLDMPLDGYMQQTFIRFYIITFAKIRVARKHIFIDWEAIFIASSSAKVM